MSNSLNRILKLAENLYKSGNNEALEILCVHFTGYARKRLAHYEAKNDGTTPNPWRNQMDYSGYENSPYFGSVSEFLEKFPGGIPDWVEWRRKTQKERNQLWSKMSERRGNIRKKIAEQRAEAHYEPVGGDDVDKFSKEPHLYSDRGLEKFKSVEEFVKTYRSQDADDGKSAALKAVKDIIGYWKLLLKKDKKSKGKK